MSKLTDNLVKKKRDLLKHHLNLETIKTTDVIMFDIKILQNLSLRILSVASD